MMAQNLRIAILDDNFSIRHSLRLIVNSVLEGCGIESEMYSITDGVEGVGYILVTVPDIIIIDSTLPKYSGREVIEYLQTNDKFAKKGAEVIVLHDGGKDLGELAQFQYINKQDSDFVTKFESLLQGILHQRYPELKAHSHKNQFLNGFNKFFLQSAVYWGTRSDLLQRELGQKNILVRGAYYVALAFYQILLALADTVLFVYRKPSEANFIQAASDSSYFRVRAYPTASVVMASLIILVLQVGLLVSGGAILFNSRIESVFADYSKEVTVDLADSIFAESVVRLNGGQLQLVPNIPESNGGSSSSSSSSTSETSSSTSTSETSSSETSTSSETSSSETSTSSESSTSSSEPAPSSSSSASSSSSSVAPSSSSSSTSSSIESSSSSSEGADVLGIETSASEVTYPTSKPIVEFRKEVKFTRLLSIREESSINNRTTSVPVLSEDMKTDLKTRVLPENGISYQISSDAKDWYYVNADAEWDKATADPEKSNTVQEINYFLPEFNETVADSEKRLFIRIFLHSDGNRQVSLQKLTVERELDMITPIEPEKAPENEVPNSFPNGGGNENPGEMPNSFPTSFPGTETPVVNADWVKRVEPVVLNAADAGGQKVLSGRIDYETKDLAVILAVIKDLKVEAYFSASGNVRRPATGVGELIGSTSVVNVKKFGETQLLWELRTPAKADGFITVKLVFTDSAGKKYESTLAKPLQS